MDSNRTSNQTHESRPLESLPIDFAWELRRLDERIAETVADEQTPAGLVDRVYAASVEQLPMRNRRPRQRATVDRGHALMGRLALAASLGLAFMVAALVLRTPTTEPAPINDVEVVPIAKTTDCCTPLSQEALLVLAGWSEEDEAGVAYLVDTHGTTLADVTDELERVTYEYEFLVSNLEEM